MVKCWVANPRPPKGEIGSIPISSTKLRNIMAKDFYDKLQIWSNTLKDNKSIAMFLLVMVCGNGFQFVQGLESNFMKKILIDQITIMANLNQCKK